MVISQRLSDDEQTGFASLKVHTKINSQCATRNLLIIAKGPESLALSPADVVVRGFLDDLLILKVRGLSVNQQLASHAYGLLAYDMQTCVPRYQ